jgi:hypothetical protein
MSIIHIVDEIFYFSSPLLVGIGIIAWVVGLIAEIKRRRTKDISERAPARKLFFAGGIIFTGTIILMFLMVDVVKWQARKEIGMLLVAEITSVQVNRQAMANSVQFVTDMRKIRNSIDVYHHSHPTKNFEVMIQTSKGNLKLNLARDSGYPQEYWIFYPSYKVTSSNDIGKILTTTLDEY